MRQRFALLTVSLLLAACKTVAPPMATLPSGPLRAWPQRMTELQRAPAWTLDGRAAVAVGTQGWQASLNWQQQGASSTVHLAGPLGVGALVLIRTPEGLSLNGAPPNDDVIAQLRDRLGFDLPLDELRYWLLGVPAPDGPSEVIRNAQDRAARVAQSGWAIDYDRYAAADGDLLPAHVVLTRDAVRVRVAVDRWTLTR